MRSGARQVGELTEGWVFVASGLPGTTSYDEAAAAGESVSLPHTWNALDGQDGGGDYRRGQGTYVTTFPAPQDTDRQVWLEVTAASSSARVFLNGTGLGGHDGGYSTFRVDLTPALAATNTLVVVVDNAPSESVYPQRADFTFYGGLYRSVRLVTVAPAHFALDDAGGPGVVVTPDVRGSVATVAVRAAVTGGDAVRFVVPGVGETTAEVVDGTAAGEIVIDPVRRWDGRHDPHRYELRAELVSRSEVVDEVDLRFGCRTFSVDPDRGFLLNDRPYPLRGVSRHQDWEGVGNAITRAMMETDLALLLELGATTVRLAHYQHDQRFYDLCDEAGIVVWAEVPYITARLADGFANARSQLVELVTQNRHHPSIVVWGLSNEITIGGTSAQILAEHRELHELVHRLDPTRLSAMAHAFLLETDDPLMVVADVMSYNLYYGWYMGELEDNERWFDTFRADHPAVAVGLSEYGADANVAFQTGAPVRGDYTEQYQAVYHEHMLDVVEARPYLWATHVWNLADFGADGREEGGVAGRNLKGLVTFDRSVRKDAFYLYKAAWSDEPFVHVAGRRYVDRAEEVTEVTVYSNQQEVTLLLDGVTVGTRTGRRTFRFAVPLTGEHVLTARSGDLEDSITLRRVEQPEPSYRMATAAVSNWFDEPVSSPEGFFSIRDTLADIRRTPEGDVLISSLLESAAASRGDVARDVQLSPALTQMLNRLTVEALLRQSGGAVPAEQVVSLNHALNRIPVPTKEASR